MKLGENSHPIQYHIKLRSKKGRISITDAFKIRKFPKLAGHHLPNSGENVDLLGPGEQSLFGMHDHFCVKYIFCLETTKKSFGNGTNHNEISEQTEEVQKYNGSNVKTANDIIWTEAVALQPDEGYNAFKDKSEEEHVY